MALMGREYEASSLFENTPDFSATRSGKFFEAEFENGPEAYEHDFRIEAGFSGAAFFEKDGRLGKLEVFLFATP